MLLGNGTTIESPQSLVILPLGDMLQQNRVLQPTRSQAIVGEPLFRQEHENYDLYFQSLLSEVLAANLSFRDAPNQKTYFQ